MSEIKAGTLTTYEQIETPYQGVWMTDFYDILLNDLYIKQIYKNWDQFKIQNIKYQIIFNKLNQKTLKIYGQSDEAEIEGTSQFNPLNDQGKNVPLNQTNQASEMILKGFNTKYRHSGVEITDGKMHQYGFTPCTIKEQQDTTSQITFDPIQLTQNYKIDGLKFWHLDDQYVYKNVLINITNAYMYSSIKPGFHFIKEFFFVQNEDNAYSLNDLIKFSDNIQILAWNEHNKIQYKNEIQDTYGPNNNWFTSDEIENTDGHLSLNIRQNQELIPTWYPRLEVYCDSDYYSDDMDTHTGFTYTLLTTIDYEYINQYE